MAQTIKRKNDALSELPATLVAGAFLLASLLLPLAGYSQAELLAWVPVVVCGVPLLYLAIWRVIHNPGISKISSALLICMAKFAALFIGELFAAGEVAFILALGAIMEDKTTERAKKGLHKLISLAPETARIVRDAGVEEVPIAQVLPGNVVRVLPGEAVPVDGEVVSGQTSVDQSVMTGESLPVDVGPGDEVYSGTVRRRGARRQGRGHRCAFRRHASRGCHHGGRAQVHGRASGASYRRQRPGSAHHGFARGHCGHPRRPAILG